MFYDDDAHFRQRLKGPNTQRLKLPSFDIIQNIPKRVLHSHTPPFWMMAKYTMHS